MHDRQAEQTERFTELVNLDDWSIPLDEVALRVAAHAFPRLDVQHELSRIDHLASQCPDPILPGLLRLLFRDQGFVGNRGDYYDPRNSFLNEVLNRRLGIPITLSVLLIEVGRRLGVALDGVGMPGHFLVRDHVDPTIFIDAFGGGVLLDQQGCERLFQSLQGAGRPLDPEFLRPIARAAIASRMLSNLRAIYSQRRDMPSLLWVTRLRTRLPDADDTVWREHATVLANAGHVVEAIAAFEQAGRLAPQHSSNDRLAVDRLRARLN
ncbi:MAG TPA: transglutaminase-like domain-containing protein [Acidimicrobiales bacterium]|nr:transglutaminase-like domain-containing protein [Acidimicrobiales bacterium]